MTEINVQLNFFYMHYNDAKMFAKWAEDRNLDSDANPSIYARHGIISSVFASEALINRVLNDFGKDREVFNTLEKASILDKWYLAPYLCCDSESSGNSFIKGEEPFQSFKELISIRNWLAHPKVEIYINAKLDPYSSISVGPSDEEEYPWLEMLKGEQWQQTKIPKNPFEIDYTHAKSSIKIIDYMIEALKSKLMGQMYEGWLDEIVIKDKDGLHNYRAPVSTIWGGYGGSES